MIDVAKTSYGDTYKRRYGLLMAHQRSCCARGVSRGVRCRASARSREVAVGRVLSMRRLRQRPRRASLQVLNIPLVENGNGAAGRHHHEASRWRNIEDDDNSGQGPATQQVLLRSIGAELQRRYSVLIGGAVGRCCRVETGRLAASHQLIGGARHGPHFDVFPYRSVTPSAENRAPEFHDISVPSMRCPIHSSGIGSSVM